MDALFSPIRFNRICSVLYHLTSALDNPLLLLGGYNYIAIIIIVSKMNFFLDLLQMKVINSKLMI